MTWLLLVVHLCRCPPFPKPCRIKHAESPVIHLSYIFFSVCVCVCALIQQPFDILYSILGQEPHSKKQADEKAQQHSGMSIAHKPTLRAKVDFFSFLVLFHVLLILFFLGIFAEQGLEFECCNFVITSSVTMRGMSDKCCCCRQIFTWK